MEWWSIVENVSPPPLEKRGLRMLSIYDGHRSKLPLQASTLVVTARTRVSKIFERSEDGVDLRSFHRFLMPTLLSNLPDRRGHPWGIKGMRHLWSLASHDHDDHIVVCEFWKRHLSGCELKTKAIRIQIYHTFVKWIYLHNDH